MAPDSDSEHIDYDREDFENVQDHIKRLGYERIATYLEGYRHEVPA